MACFQAAMLPQVQRQLSVYQDSRRSASDEIARLTATNISLTTDVELAKLQQADTAKRLAELKVGPLLVAVGGRG